MNIVLDCIRKPQNLGAIMRTAIATSSTLYLTGNCINPDHRKVKSQIYTWWRSKEPIKNYLKIETYPTLEELVKSKRDTGNIFLGTSPNGEINYWSMTICYSDIFIVFGPEEGGLSKEKLKLMNNVIKIPMNNVDVINSLNLATSVALIAYECMKQRMIFKHGRQVSNAWP